VERVNSPAAARVTATPWCGGGPLIVHGGTRGRRGSLRRARTAGGRAGRR
jgi:hypothetical protein